MESEIYCELCEWHGEFQYWREHMRERHPEEDIHCGKCGEDYKAGAAEEHVCEDRKQEPEELADDDHGIELKTEVQPCNHLTNSDTIHPMKRSYPKHGEKWDMNIHWRTSKEGHEYINRLAFASGIEVSELHRRCMLRRNWKTNLQKLRVKHRAAGIPDKNFL